MQRARCYLLGESAVVLELEPPITLVSQRRIWGLAERLMHHEDVREVIPGMNNLTVLLTNPQQLALDAIERLQSWWEDSDAITPEPRAVSIPVIYGGEDGPDLSLVAEFAGMTPSDVVACHAGSAYDVYFIGFQPGFPYLGGLPERLSVPRRGEPRLKVPAGSVGIGGRQTGIYPLASPGGWQIIGRTPLKLFNPDASRPTLLLPGDSVRFVPQKEGIC
ncbi:5-oxoprolinase subunit PxpB [Sodalis ligni]|uniref:KipI family sensor histidine kinase inhibitor n=1 Tax=Sodalis ligni TaxID=2697027 RepID=A0A4R1NB98_9GAMM|nr:5-oxoprolinase subunit PxpB [Sodalis ligni]QWA12578.1 5-oxoprolinase subunit PxpB [Sodalis ligni]TCL03979.1 KipI family sensor histidine kinase inhibitor [Sodalis ligni]